MSPGIADVAPDHPTLLHERQHGASEISRMLPRVLPCNSIGLERTKHIIDFTKYYREMKVVYRWYDHGCYDA